MMQHKVCHGGPTTKAWAKKLEVANKNSGTVEHEILCRGGQREEKRKGDSRHFK